MTPTLFLALALCGGAGACARFIVDGLIKSRLSGVLPWGTIVINLSGSFVLGLLTGLAGAHLLPQGWLLVLGTGFLGGYTTFSTASFETVRLIQSGKTLAGALNALGTLGGATCAAAIGLWLGALL